MGRFGACVGAQARRSNRRGVITARHCFCARDEIGTTFALPQPFADPLKPSPFTTTVVDSIKHPHLLDTCIFGELLDEPALMNTGIVAPLLQGGSHVMKMIVDTDFVPPNKGWVNF